MKINRQELINILNSIKPGLSKKAIVEQATHFIFTGHEIITYNDRICIIYPFTTDFSCSVPAEEFYKILSNIHREEISIDYKEQKLYIKAKGINAGIVTDTGDSILKMVDILDLDYAIEFQNDIPEDFIHGMSMCMFSASKDMTIPVLSCLFVNGKNIASTDDYRISQYKMKSRIKGKFLIPATSVMELVKFDIVKYSILDSWVFFFTKENMCFCAKTIKGDFPDYEPFIKDFDEISIALPEDSKEMIEAACILSEGDTEQDKEIDIQIKDNIISIKGENKIGWVESQTSVKFDNNAKFCINPFFLLKILNKTNIMHLADNKVMFKSVNFKHVIALKGE